MKDHFRLFFLFMKLGAFNFGGGYSMLPLLEREIVQKRGWATSEEINDYFAIGQCTPGVIAVNVSTFIGYKLKGIKGGIIATIGFIFPALIIITIIAAVLNNFSDIKQVQDAFAGIRVCVCALILAAIIKLFKKSIIDYKTLLIYLVILGLGLFLDISPVLFVIGAGAMGILLRTGGKKE